MKRLTKCPYCEKENTWENHIKLKHPEKWDEFIKDRDSGKFNDILIPYKGRKNALSPKETDEEQTKTDIPDKKEDNKTETLNPEEKPQETSFPTQEIDVVETSEPEIPITKLDDETIVANTIWLLASSSNSVIEVGLSLIEIKLNSVKFQQKWDELFGKSQPTDRALETCKAVARIIKRYDKELFNALAGKDIGNASENKDYIIVASFCLSIASIIIQCRE